MQLVWGQDVLIIPRLLNDNRTFFQTFVYSFFYTAVFILPTFALGSFIFRRRIYSAYSGMKTSYNKSNQVKGNQFSNRLKEILKK